MSEDRRLTDLDFRNNGARQMRSESPSFGTKVGCGFLIASRHLDTRSFRARHGTTWLQTALPRSRFAPIETTSFEACPTVENVVLLIASS